MGKRNTIIYDTVAELQDFVKTVELPTMCLPNDNPRQLAKGYVTFVLRDDNTEVEGSEVYHIAPLYDSLEECKEIKHDSADTFFKTRDKFLTDHKTTMHPSDDPMRLRIGFVIHPQREWHNISFNLINEILNLTDPEARAEVFTKNNSA